MSLLHSSVSAITVAALMCHSNTLQLNESFYIINSRSSVKVEVTLYRFVLVSTLLISSKPLIFLLCPPVLSSGDICSGEMLVLLLLSPSLCLYLIKLAGNIFSRRYSLKIPEERIFHSTLLHQQLVLAEIIKFVKWLYR